MSGLEIEWLVEAALIDSIVDVPDDQGGWVLVHFTRSGRDFADEAALPISSYGIWRRVESAVLVAALQEEEPATVESRNDGEAPDFAGLPVISYDGKVYVQSRPGLEAASFPPGTWVMVATVTAAQQDTYIVAVPTTGDSSTTGSNRTVFVLTAYTTTPSIWYVSEPDSGYSVDNLAPCSPAGLAGKQRYTPEGLELSWRSNDEPDLDGYAIYRGTSPDFVPGPGNLVASIPDTVYVDGGWRWNGDYWYKVAAMDIHGNESGYAVLGPDGVTGGETPGTPAASYLSQSYPNPFNPSTRISFGLAAPGRISLRIYDAAGHLVRVLVDGARPAGHYSELWDGRDSGGRAMASGVYFYRLNTGSFAQTMKMVLLK